VEASVDPEEMRQLIDGVEALNRLAQTLTQSVYDHNRWQNLDVELRRVDAVLVHDMERVFQKSGKERPPRVGGCFFEGNGGV
jgi:predicted Zn-dependent peptidase